VSQLHNEAILILSCVYVVEKLKSVTQHTVPPLIDDPSEGVMRSSVRLEAALADS
jgi:hypothetical protein